MSNNELMHYGVLGMKWGHRKNTYKSDLSIARSNYKNAKKSYRRSEISSDSLRKSKEALKKAKKDNKRAIDKAYNNLSYRGVLNDGIRYNQSVYKKAAKNMVNKGMDKKTALSKAKASAWRNYGLAVGANLAYTHRDKMLSSVKKYANEKAMQRANKSLARIGTMKLKHMGKNVYEWQMG